jgi:hypothetical protein
MRDAAGRDVDDTRAELERSADVADVGPTSTGAPADRPLDEWPWLFLHEVRSASIAVMVSKWSASGCTARRPDRYRGRVPFAESPTGGRSSVG